MLLGNFSSEVRVEYGDFIRWCPIITTLVEGFVFSCKLSCFSGCRIRQDWQDESAWLTQQKKRLI